MSEVRSVTAGRDGDVRAARIYLVRVLATVLVLSAALFTFNILVDPLGLFRIVTIPGVNNDRRPALESGHRSIREIEIVRRMPDTLILGTSRELYGIEPSQVSHRFGGRVHNASIAAATLGDFEGLLIGAGAAVGVRKVLIGLDYFSFDDRRIPALPATAGIGSIAVRSLRQVLRATATVPGLIQSIETIGASRCRPDGEEFPADGHRVLEIAISPCGLSRQPIPTPEAAAGVIALFDFDSQAGAMAAFDRILRHCVDRALECHPFIGPMHGVYLSALRQSDWARFQSWKADLAAVAARYDVVLLDLSSALPASKLPFAQRPDRFYDTLHYGTQIGAATLDALAGGAASPDRLIPEAGRLAAFRVRDEAAIAGFENSDPEYSAALMRSIRTRPGRPRRE